MSGAAIFMNASAASIDLMIALVAAAVVQLV
jgi:hypothetical protein